MIYNDQTDPWPTFMNFTPPNSIKVNKYISYSFRFYSESNKEKLREHLTNIEENWLDVLSSNNVDKVLQKCSSFLDELYCQFFPRKKLRVNLQTSKQSLAHFTFNSTNKT